MNIKRLLLLYGFAMALTSLGCKEGADNGRTGEVTNDQNTDRGKNTQSARTEILSPEEERAGFRVPEGFVVELVASEKDGVVNPIHMAFDDAGRLWTQTAKM